jgi:hypothetical protein
MKPKIACALLANITAKALTAVSLLLPIAVRR